MTGQQSRSRRRTATRGILIAGVVVVVVAAGGLWWFLSGSSPEEVNVATAAETLSDDPPEGIQPTSIEGLWTVDTSIGSFSFDDATSSFVGFRIEEQLAGIGAATAVGRTPVVSGEIRIEGTTLTSARVEADFTAIVSNDSRRDRRIQSAVETDQFPTATFELSDPVQLGAVPAAGDTLSVTATGELTVHGVTNTIEIPLQAQLVNDVIVVVGSTDMVFIDYGVEVPSAPIVLSVEDHGIVELQLFLTRA